MDDYHAILSDAVRSLGARDRKGRQNVYDKAGALLEVRLRNGKRPAAAAEIKSHRAALADAIDRIESEIAGLEISDGPVEATETGSRVAQPLISPWRRAFAVGFAIVAAAAIATAYVLWTAATRPSLTDREAIKADAVQREDLAPGVDGGSSDAGLPYYLRRQTVFYRSTHPVGTLVVHKFQHYIYFVVGDTVAWRYGIGLGEGCIEVAGLRHVAQKSEWPSWRSDETAGRRPPVKGELPGGPGNPLGARVLDLDDGNSRIHGTNAPGTIGTTVERGCIRLVNEDVIDLYERIPVGTRVVITN